MSAEPDDAQDEAWVEALLDQIGEERLLKSLGRILTKAAQKQAEEESDDCGDLVSNLLFSAARHMEDAAMDLYVSSK